MNFRASPPIRFNTLDRVTGGLLNNAPTAAAEVFGAGNFVSANFKSLRTTGVTWAGGFAQPVTAIMPDAHMYDRLRITFGSVVLGTVTAMTLGLFAAIPERDGTITASLIGTSTLTNGQFPAILVDQYDARYYLAVLSTTGAGATFRTSVSGVYADHGNTVAPA